MSENNWLITETTLTENGFKKQTPHQYYRALDRMSAFLTYKDQYWELSVEYDSDSGRNVFVFPKKFEDINKLKMVIEAL